MVWGVDPKLVANIHGYLRLFVLAGVPSNPSQDDGTVILV